MVLLNGLAALVQDLAATCLFGSGATSLGETAVLLLGLAVML